MSAAKAQVRKEKLRKGRPVTCLNSRSPAFFPLLRALPAIQNFHFWHVQLSFFLFLALN
jgi:hypothetical protein